MDKQLINRSAISAIKNHPERIYSSRLAQLALPGSMCIDEPGSYRDTGNY